MSLLDRLEEAGDFAPGWNPTAEGTPQQVIGVITDIGQGTDYNGDPYLIYTIKQEDGERWAIHGFSTVLRQELGKYKLRPGIEMGVKYMGIPAGKKYHRYAVVADAEMNLDPGTVDADVAAAVKSDLETPGFKPQEDFRPQSTLPNGDADPVPF